MAAYTLLEEKSKTTSSADDPVKITITLDNEKFHADPPSQSVSDKQTIVWTCTTNNFRIVFPGLCPNTHKAHVDAQQMPDSSFQAHLFVNLPERRKGQPCRYIIPPLGHGSKAKAVLDDPQPVIIVECSSCHDKYKGKRD